MSDEVTNLKAAISILNKQAAEMNDELCKLRASNAELDKVVGEFLLKLIGYHGFYNTPVGTLRFAK